MNRRRSQYFSVSIIKTLSGKRFIDKLFLLKFVFRFWAILAINVLSALQWCV